jgi:hypothetical protein
MLTPTSLFATLVLWAALIGPAPVRSSLPAGRVLDHADLNGDGSQELIVALPDSCDEDNTCVVAVYQPEGDGYRVVLPPSILWDLSPSSVTPADAGGWADLVEARREGPAADDITTVLWRFDGQQYRRVESTRKRLPTTPDWVSSRMGPPCPTTTIS